MAFTSVEIMCGGLTVNVQTDLSYPDGMDDICNRSLALFKESVATAKQNGIDITVMSLQTDAFDDYEE